MSVNGAPVMAAAVVAVDVGKKTAAVSVTDAAWYRLLGPVEFAMTAPGLAVVLQRVCAVLPDTPVRVGGGGGRGIITGRCWSLGCGQQAGSCWS